MVKGGSIPSSNFERSCFEWSNQNLFKDWKVIAVGTMLTAAETAITHLEYGEPYAVKVCAMSCAERIVRLPDQCPWKYVENNT